jgi:probable addiction module antidote protein
VHISIVRRKQIIICKHLLCLPGYISHALGVVARAKGMAQIAGQTGLSREQLYRSFSAKGNPTLKTTLAVMNALGVQLTAKIPSAA